jgi:hypothetical protein
MDKKERINIEIPIEPLTGNNSNDKGILTGAIEENQGSFEQYFERLIDFGDARQTIDDDSLEVTDISFDKDGGIADVTYNSSHYMGCKDLDSSGDHDASLEFTITDSVMSFEIELPHAWKPQ